MAAPFIAIANHDTAYIRLLGQVLDKAGFESTALPEGTLAYEEIKKRRPDLIILDTWLESREAGWTLFQMLRLDEETKQIPVLICSSDVEEFEKRAASLDDHTHVGVLHKPFDVDKLVLGIRLLLAPTATPNSVLDGATR